jgi:hypothetical protein
VAFNSNTALAFQVHIVENLRLQVLSVDSLRKFKQTVGKRTLTVIDVGYNTKVADIFHFFK